MKVPEKVRALLRKRAKAAESFIRADVELNNWLDKNNIEVCDYDGRGGVEAYTNPWQSAERVYMEIVNKE